MADERLHIAAISSTGSGHINPMLEFCRLLVPRGFRVSFIYPSNLCPQVKSKLQSDDLHITLVPSPPSDKLLLMDPEVMEQMKPVLQALHPPAKCIISDYFLGWSKDLADSLNIPRIVLFTSDSSTEAFLYYIDELVSSGHIPLEKSDNQTLIDFIPGFDPFPKEMLPVAFATVSHITMTLAAAAKQTKAAAAILINTIEELDQQLVSARRSEFSNYLAVGPLVSPTLLQEHVSTSSPSDDPCLSWLDKHAPRSVLYIAFGSVVTLKVRDAEKIAEAVKESCQPVLWAIRQKFSGDVPEDFYEGLQERVGTQALVVEWAPQVDVLRHPAVGAFWSHCGWNSSLEALCTGVPMLCWPCAADQNVNASTIVNKWKIGMMVTDGPQDDATCGDLQKAMHTMMKCEEGETMRCRAQELREIVREGTCRERSLQKVTELIIALSK